MLTWLLLLGALGVGCGDGLARAASYGIGASHLPGRLAAARLAVSGGDGIDDEGCDGGASTGLAVAAGRGE
jgi:hypothetical protein